MSAVKYACLSLVPTFRTRGSRPAFILYTLAEDKMYTQGLGKVSIGILPLLNLVKCGEPLAVDCEGVVLPKETAKYRQGLGRVSIVTSSGKVVYDTFAYYPEEVSSRARPKWKKLGVYWPDIKPWVSQSLSADSFDSLNSLLICYLE